MGKKKRKTIFPLIGGIIDTSDSLEAYCSENERYLDDYSCLPTTYEHLLPEQPISMPPKKPLMESRLTTLSHKTTPIQTLFNNTILNFAADDTGNADRFEAIYGDVVRFNVGSAMWYVWDGKCWRLDDLLAIKEMAERVVGQYRDEAKSLEENKNEAERRLFNHSRQSCNSNRIKALIEILKHRHSVRQSDFDQHLDKITVANGIVDLRTGELLEFDSTLLLTQYVDVQYSPEAYQNSAFKKFIGSICGYDKSHQRYLQTAFGYGITGETREQVMFIEHGSGSNGKTTLNEAIATVVSDFAKHVPVQLLLNLNDSISKGRASSELAQSFNKRILIASEGEEGGAFKESVVKLLTGGSTISVRNLFKGAFEFKPAFKIFLDTNHLPHVKGKDYAIWRRLKVIPFKVTLNDDDKDITLPETLATQREKEAILAWLIKGAVRYYHDGLIESQVAVDATVEYIDREDTFRPFLKNCILSDDAATCSASKLYSSYIAHCTLMHRKPENNTVFGTILRMLGYEKKRCASGYHYLGFRLKDEQCV